MKRGSAPPQAAVVEKFYHGGPSGLDRIKPPSATGADSTADHGAPARSDRVYVTPSYAAALMFASGHKDPCIYEVSPVGPMERDPDCYEPGLSFECAEATVIRIYKPKWKHVLRARKAILA